MLSKSDLALIQRDPGIPALRTLLDPEAFVNLIRGLYPELVVADLSIAYVKYKPKTSCLVGYQVISEEKAIDLYATAYHSQAHDKIQKAKDRPRVSGLFGPCRMILEEKKIVVSLFPNDDKLRSLRQVAAPDLRRKLLKNTLFLNEDLDDVDILKLAYKPERRFVAQLISENNAMAALKMYTKTGYSVPLWNAKAFHSTDSFRLPRLLGHNERHNVLIFEWLPGKTLMELIINPEFELGIMKNVGAALCELHKQDPQVLGSCSIEDEISKLLALSQIMGFMCPNLAIRTDQLAQKLIERLIRLPEKNLPIHGDFYAKQVIVNQNQISFIDFDSAVRGNPAADLGNFIAHLIRYQLRNELCPDRVGPMAETLLDGYLSANKGELYSELNLFTAISLFQIAPHSFRHREPNWVERTEALLNKANSYFEKHRHSTTAQFAGINFAQDYALRNIPCIHVEDPYNVTTDPMMPFVIQALNPDFMSDKLKAIFQSADGGIEINLEAIRVTRYKQGRRCLIEYDLQLSNLHDRKDKIITIIGKVRSKDAHHAAFNLAKTMWNGKFGPNSADGICVPEPIAIIPELHMWMQYKVEGEVATLALQSSDGPSISGRIAEAIAKVHQENFQTRKQHTIDDELNILQDRLSKVAEGQHDWKARLQQLMKQCTLQAKLLPERVRCGIHRDFYHDQVIINGSKIYLIDFDLFCEGDPSLDIGNFIGHLIELRIRSNSSNETVLKECEDAFKKRYIELNREPNRNAINTYTILTLARHIYISTLFPDRREYTERILKLCEQYLYRYTKDPSFPSGTFLEAPKIAS